MKDTIILHLGDCNYFQDQAKKNIQNNHYYYFIMRLQNSLFSIYKLIEKNTEESYTSLKLDLLEYPTLDNYTQKIIELEEDLEDGNFD